MARRAVPRYWARVGASGEDRLMTMAEARRHHADGQLWSSHGSSRDMYRGTGRGPATVSIIIDTTDMRRLAAQYGQAFATMKAGRTSLSRAINHGLRRLNTELKYKVKEWTGIRVVGEVTKGFRSTWSTPETLVGRLRVEDRHRVLSRRLFGAAWSRSNPGGTHHAWNRGQIAVGSFMQPSQKTLMKRVGTSRKPIKPLYGPNFAREIERHRPEVQGRVTIVTAQVQREGLRLLRVALTGKGR